MQQRFTNAMSEIGRFSWEDRPSTVTEVAKVVRPQVLINQGSVVLVPFPLRETRISEAIASVTASIREEIKDALSAANTAEGQAEQ